MTLLERDLVVVHQKAKLVELTNQYELQDADGNGIGFVEEVGQSKGRKVLRALTKFDQYLTHRLEIRDGDGSVALSLVRPAKFMKSRVDVTDAAGTAIGSIVQQNVMGKKRFTFEAPDGSVVGELLGENWRSWDFQIVDPNGVEVARVTKKWSGLLREGFTTADRYVFEAKPGLTGTLRPLAFAAALAIDTALKQDDR